jgi:tRNA-dihydrouridine synthase B
MDSGATLHHGNERTVGYLRISPDERPLVVRIFGSEPEVMAEAAKMVKDAGADLVDVNFGCPSEGDQDKCGSDVARGPAARLRGRRAVAGAVTVPLSVKMWRGLESGSRACLELGPKLVEAGTSSLTLHPRSARQMYTGEADHSLSGSSSR